MKRPCRCCLTFKRSPNDCRQIDSQIFQCPEHLFDKIKFKSDNEYALRLRNRNRCQAQEHNFHLLGIEKLMEFKSYYSHNEMKTNRFASVREVNNSTNKYRKQNVAYN